MKMMLNTSLRNCDVCPMCKRPFGRNPKSRSGNNPGLEKQAANCIWLSHVVTVSGITSSIMMGGYVRKTCVQGWVLEIGPEEYVNSLKNMALSSKGRWLSLKGENEK